MIPATASRPCSTTSSQTAVTALSRAVRTRTGGLHALHISPQVKVHLALYRPHRWQDIGGYVIAWWTRSAYSHCELVIDGWCYSSSIQDGGVRRKQIDLAQPHWTVIDIDVDPAKVLVLFERTKGEPYGWLDLITQQVLRLPVSSAGWFCSEWVAAALGLTDPEIWSPGMLARHYGVEK